MRNVSSWFVRRRRGHRRVRDRGTVVRTEGRVARGAVALRRYTNPLWPGSGQSFALSTLFGLRIIHNFQGLQAGPVLPNPEQLWLLSISAYTDKRSTWNQFRAGKTRETLSGGEPRGFRV